MKAYQSTAKQAAFCEVLAKQITPEQYKDAYHKACSINGNQWKDGETVTRQVRALSKKVASQLITDLLEIRDEGDNHGKQVPSLP